MKNSIDIADLGKGLSGFLRRFHTLLFFLVVSGGLFAAIALLLSIIALSSTTATSASQTINGTFDENTIQRLKQSSSAQATPGARPSPFVE